MAARRVLLGISSFGVAAAISRPTVLKEQLLGSKADLDGADIPQPAPPTDFPAEVKRTVYHMNEFITNAPEDGASLLFMGDSTVRTMNNMLLWIGKATTIHVKNDRPSDQPPYPVFSEGSNLIQPGAEYRSPKHADHPALLRAVAASKEIRDRGCTWGGTMETILLGAPMEGLVIHYWNFLPEYSSHGCWQKCMADAVAKLQPRGMMWNIGMHMMNEQFDTETCQKRSSHADPNCGDYKQLVTAGMQDLSRVVPTLIWKTTNSICDKKLKEMHNPDGMDEWQSSTHRPKMEQKCHKECPLYKESESCYDWLAVQHTTERMHSISTNIVETYKNKKSDVAKVHLLDAFSRTKQCCDNGCPDTPDGMHYINGTDAYLMWNVAKIVAEDEIERRK